MSIFDRIFRRKKKVEPLPPVEKPPEKLPGELPEAEKIRADNIKAKLDLIMTELDNIKTQNQMINERLKGIEKKLIEMRGIRYY